MPLPYNAWLTASRNFSLSIFIFHLLHSSSPNIAKNTPIRSDGGACI